MPTLPELPRKRKQTEADITPKVIRWFRDIYRKSCVFEIKVPKGAQRTISMRALAPHQYAALMLASRGTLAHKISDAGRTRQPFDGFVVSNVSAYVVACFPATHVCYVIPIQEWRGAKEGMEGTITFSL